MCNFFRCNKEKGVGWKVKAIKCRFNSILENIPFIRKKHKLWRGEREALWNIGFNILSLGRLLSGCFADCAGFGRVEAGWEISLS